MGLFGRFGKKKNQDAQPEVKSSKPYKSPLASSPLAEDPVPFGYKISWLCIRSGSPEAVMTALDLRKPIPSGWAKGLEHAGECWFFVSDSIDGYVLVIGWGEHEKQEELMEKLEMVSMYFPEVQYFASHRVSETYAWLKYIDSALVRGYFWCGDQGELLLNEGEITEEEKRLGFDKFPQSVGPAIGETSSPDEEDVIKLAAAWGIDPSFKSKMYPPSAGYMCED